MSEQTLIASMLRTSDGLRRLAGLVLDRRHMGPVHDGSAYGSGQARRALVEAGLEFEEFHEVAASRATFAEALSAGSGPL